MTRTLRHHQNVTRTMTVISRQHIHTLKRQLHDAHKHMLDLETVYHRSGHGAAAGRSKDLAQSILLEIGHLNLLLESLPQLPTPVRIP